MDWLGPMHRWRGNKEWFEHWDLSAWSCGFGEERADQSLFTVRLILLVLCQTPQNNKNTFLYEGSVVTKVIWQCCLTWWCWWQMEYATLCVCVYWSVWYEWMDFFKQGMICRWATVLCSRSYSFFLNLCLWIVITQHADADYNTKTKEELR